MLDETETPATTTPDKPVRRRAAGRPAGPPKAALTTDIFSAPVAAPKAKVVKPQVEKAAAVAAASNDDAEAVAVAKKAPAKKAPAKKAAAKKAPAKKAAAKPVIDAGGLLFKAPDLAVAPARKKVAKPAAANAADNAGDHADTAIDNESADSQSSPNNDHDDDFDEDGAPRRRRRSRGGRRRRKPEDGDENHDSSTDDGNNNNEDDNGNPTLRRRRRRRAGEDADTSPDDPENTTVRVREPRSAEDEIASVSGSTRLEAKKQRRREGREAGRRRAPIVSEAEFLARRESVKREMAIRQRPEYTQIAVLEDNVLVEHYVARESQISLIGNVYLGKVQNVLPSMEAAFVDIGKGRNAVLYAGEVDWTTLGNGKQRKIEDVLTSGQTVLVQVTKDPIGQKGARLTSQISLAGRFLVYVPGGQTSGISRKLPDTERTRLKNLLKEVLPEDAGVIVRTAAEGATEEQLTRDVSALTARWEDIQRKVEAGHSPDLLYSEPDLTLKVVRDLFNEDFNRLVIEGDDAWDMVSAYISHVAPDLMDRLEQWDGGGDSKDVFSALRVDEQISKALDRKVFLPSGGSLVIDRTEAMTVVDVNTGKFTGSGGNLEETVTKNNLEAAEEIVRQLRLRDIGGIIVVDFIDMVLESNRELVLRRLVECLGRDRTRHQVAEVTSLGLVQMTRKRIGTGLLESFGHDCDHCHGRGVVVEAEPVEPKGNDDSSHRRNRRGGRNNASQSTGSAKVAEKPVDKPADKPAEKKSGRKADKIAEVPAETPTRGQAASTSEAAVDAPRETAITSVEAGADKSTDPSVEHVAPTKVVADVVPEIAAVAVPQAPAEVPTDGPVLTSEAPTP